MKNCTGIEILFWYLGGFDNHIKGFTLIIIVEIISEVMVSIIKDNSLIRCTLTLFSQKIAEYILIGIGNTMDTYILQDEKSFRDIIIIFYIVYECLKVLYNASEIDLPIPNKIKKMLEIIFYKEYDEDKSKDKDKK